MMKCYLSSGVLTSLSWHLTTARPCHPLAVVNRRSRVSICLRSLSNPVQASSVVGPTVAPSKPAQVIWETMLRITVVDTPTEQRLVLYGKLVGPWIGELQRVWENVRQQLGNRRSVIDLNVSFRQACVTMGVAYLSVEQLANP